MPAHDSTAPSSSDPKFAPLYEYHTDGINYDLTTDDIVAKLVAWDARYGIEISEVTHDSLVLRFQSLPADLETFSREIYEFCPDLIDQHFGCMDEMMALYDAQPLPDPLAELVEGVDFEAENFGEVLLQNTLRLGHPLPLWWD